MLFDPKWEVEVKADPFDLENLVAWAEKQPADKTYNYHCNQCYLGQYFEAHGFRIEAIGSKYVTFVGHDQMELPPHFNSIAAKGEQTFGSALKRARRALSKTERSEP